MLFLLSFLVNGLFAQQDNLVNYCNKIKLGFNESTIDSLMVFSIADRHHSPGGSWRNMYDDVYQSTTEYTDKDWNYYTFRYLFQRNKLIYFDLYHYKTNTILYSQIDSAVVNSLIDKFQKRYNSSDSFPSILTSFHTTAYGGLDSALDSFFSGAGYKDKNRLLRYAGSLCPEYSASAVIRLLELEKDKPNLTRTEKEFLKEIINSETEIKFFIGCIYRVHKLSEFINEYTPELKYVLK